MFTKKQYMSRECTEDQYYSQYVDEKMIDLIRKSVMYKHILNAKDKNDFCDISMQQWDFVTGLILCLLGDKPFKQRGDIAMHSNLICIAKAAARKILAEREVKFT